MSKALSCFYGLALLQIYLNDGDKEEDFLIKGNFKNKHFQFFQLLRKGKDPRPIAKVEKESSFASTTAFLRNQLLDTSTYYLTIEPGVDCAFIAALATLCDEIFNPTSGYVASVTANAVKLSMGVYY